MKRLNQSFLAVTILSLAMQVTAAGFALNEYSASAAGTAYAGRGSNVEDASIMAVNPAGIALLEDRQVTVGGGLIVPMGDFEGTETGGTGQSGSNDKFLKTAMVPFGYYAMHIDDQLSFGLGFYAPFGAHSDYDDNWVGRYLADETELRVMNVQPTLAYIVSDQLSVGFGLSASYGEGKLSRFTNPSSTSDRVNIEGDDWTYGWNIGAIWEPMYGTAVGLSFRSSMKMNLRGTASDNAGNVEKAKLDITLPEMIELSFTHQLDDRTTLMAGGSWTRWNRFNQLRIESDAGNGSISSGGVITNVPEHWKNSWTAAIGASYVYNDQVTLKAGYAFDQTPVQSEYRTARIPDSNRSWLTVGAKFELVHDLTLDAAYGYMFASKAKIEEQGTLPAVRLEGEYDNTAHLFTASLTKVF